MRGHDLLDKMELADPAFVEAADAQPPGKRRSWVRWGAVAAALCLVAAGAFSLWRTGERQPVQTGLEPISIPDLPKGGMGFEGYLYYDASQICTGNPWRTDMELDTLPVYRNKAYDASGAGVPRGLSPEDMQALLESAADALGVEIISVETITEPKDDVNPAVLELHGATDNGSIEIEADGHIIYNLPDEGVQLPDGYTLADDATEEEAQAVLAYLADRYAALIHMEAPVPITWGAYNAYGDYGRKYGVYDGSGDDTADFLNHQFRRVSFVSNGDGELWFIRMQDWQLVAEKVGDYPIISPEEAEERLLTGHYQTSVPYAMPGEEYVAKVELVYRTGRLEEMLIPYYRFYVLLPEEKTVGEGRDSRLQCYGAYYVPAIAAEYIADMPLYDGHFN